MNKKFRKSFAVCRFFCTFAVCAVADKEFHTRFLQPSNYRRHFVSLPETDRLNIGDVPSPVERRTAKRYLRIFLPDLRIKIAGFKNKYCWTSG